MSVSSFAADYYKNMFTDFMVSNAIECNKMNTVNMSSDGEICSKQVGLF